MSTMQTTIQSEHTESFAGDAPIGTQLYFAADGDGLIPKTAPAGSVELVIEATNSDRETPFWLDDAWWMTAYRHWKDQSIVVRLMPTPGCLSNSVILHQLNMLRRIVPQWRIIAAVPANECPSGQTLQSGLPIDQIEVLPNGTGTTRGARTTNGTGSRFSNSKNPDLEKPVRPTLTPGRKRNGADTNGKHSTDGPNAPMPKMIYCDTTPAWVESFQAMSAQVAKTNA